MAPPKTKLPPGAELVDDSQMKLPPGAELVPESTVSDNTISALPSEGEYKMKTPKGDTISVPFSNIDSTIKLGYKLLPEEVYRYGRDASYADKVRLKNKYLRPALNLLPTAGGIAGGLFAGGTSLETGPGAIIAGALGAAAGGAGGEGLRQMGMQYFFNEGPKSVKESAKDIGKQAAIQGGSELIGRVGAATLKPVAQYYGDTAEASKKLGYRVLPSEARGVAAGTGETFTKGSVFTAKNMARWRQLQNTETEAAARKIADDISAKSLSVSGSRKEAGDAITAGIENHINAFRRLQSYLYGQIDKNAQGVMASRTDLVAFAQKALDEIKAAKLAGGNTPLSPFAQSLQDIVDNKATTAPFSAMAAARSGWLADARGSNQLLSGPEKGILKQLAKLTDESMMDAARKSGVSGLEQAVRDANAMTREEHERFEQELVKKIAERGNPEAIAVILRGTKKGFAGQIGIDETKAAMEVIPKRLVPKVQKQILLDSIDEAKDVATGDFNERKFATSILQIGDERGTVLFGKNWNNIKEFSQLLYRIKGSVGKSGAASLANPQIYKQVSRFLYESLTAGTGTGVLSGILTGNPITGIATGAAASVLPVVSEAIVWKTIAAGLTHPETAERLVEGLQHVIHAMPYIPGAIYNESGGNQPKQSWEQLKKKSEELFAPKPSSSTSPAAPITPTVTPSFDPTPLVNPDADTDEEPQARTRPYTHIFNEHTGMIEAV